MVNRVKLGEQLSVQQLWADGQLERLGPGVDTDRVSVLVAGSLIRHPANGELREQVLNQVEQRSQLPRVLTLSPHACSSLVHVDSLLTPI